MKKQMVALLAGAMLMMVSSIAGATTINYNFTPSGPDLEGLTSSYSYLYDYKVEIFNDGVLGQMISGANNNTPWIWSGSATIVKGSESGDHAAPYGLGAADSSKYVSVPNPLTSGSISVSLGQHYDYFGLWWGSVDGYNTLSFYDGAVKVASYKGSELPEPTTADGNWYNGASNRYVNFIGLSSFDSIIFESNGKAFEFDNIAMGNTTAPVPEPGTIALLGLGMAGLAVYGKRRKNNKA